MEEKRGARQEQHTGLSSATRALAPAGGRSQIFGRVRLAYVTGYLSEAMIVRKQIGRVHAL